MALAEKAEETMAEPAGSGLINGTATEMPLPDDGIRAFDQDGRQIVVPRDEWRTSVIPGMLKQGWDNPDQLYMVIVSSLNEGFVAEVAEAAEHLYNVDPIAGRGTCMWSIVLMQTGRLPEAEDLLEGFEAKHGIDGSVLVNLAKVYAEKQEMELARTTLWRAIQADPNHENGLGWYVSLEHERGGDEAAQRLLEEVAALPASWRAQLWQARGALNAGQVSMAGKFYGEALARAPRPVPPDLLMQMSGDLGSKGLLAELIELTLPNFVPEWHGMAVGNNLIKALVDTGNLHTAEQVKATLWTQSRPDWKDALAFWDAEISKRRMAGVEGGGTSAPAAPQELQVGMLRVDGPVWLPQGSPAGKLFSAKSAEAPTVTFLGGSAEAPEGDGSHGTQMADALGRMTRALPLFFAEQVEMRTAAAGRAMVPWAVAPVSGFVVSGRRWDDETAVRAAQSAENASDYVVTVHVDAEVEPWTAMMAFVRTADGTRLGELEHEFPSNDPEAGLAELADEVVELLSVLGPAASSPNYEVPRGTSFASYLMRLEQTLAVRCAAMEGVPAQFLTREADIVRAAIELCRAEPKNIPARLLLLSTASALSKLRRESANGFAEEIAKLKADHPLPVVDVLAELN